MTITIAAMAQNSLKYLQQNSLCIAMIQIIIINVLAVVQTWSNAHWIGSVIGFPCPVLSWFPPRALWVVETLHISCNSRQMSVRSHYWCVWALSRPRHINSILDLWSSGAPALVCSGGRFFSQDIFWMVVHWHYTWNDSGMSIQFDPKFPQPILHPF